MTAAVATVVVETVVEISVLITILVGQATVMEMVIITTTTMSEGPIITEPIIREVFFQKFHFLFQFSSLLFLCLFLSESVSIKGVLFHKIVEYTKQFDSFIYFISHMHILIAGAYLLAGVMDEVNTWVSIDGTVIDTNYCGCKSSGSSYGCTTTYSPVIEYFVEGIRYQFESSTCSNPSVGDSIKVLYDPNNPVDARDGSFTSIWLGPLIAFLIGIAGAGMLVYNIRKYRLVRKQQQQQQQTSMNVNTSDKIDGSNYTNSAVGGDSNGVTTSDPTVSLAEPSAPEYSTSIPYAETVTETKNDENKKPSLFDQLQASSKY